MEILVSISFDCESRDVEAWSTLLSGLCDNKQGAWLEEQFEHFGDSAESGIEALMDACEQEHGSVWFEDFSCEGNHCKCTMNGGYGVIDCIPKIAHLLSLCRTTNVRIEPESDEF